MAELAAGCRLTVAVQAEAAQPCGSVWVSGPLGQLGLAFAAIRCVLVQVPRPGAIPGPFTPLGEPQQGVRRAPPGRLDGDGDVPGVGSQQGQRQQRDGTAALGLVQCQGLGTGGISRVFACVDLVEITSMPARAAGPTSVVRPGPAGSQHEGHRPSTIPGGTGFRSRSTSSATWPGARKAPRYMRSNFVIRPSPEPADEDHQPDWRCNFTRTGSRRQQCTAYYLRSPAKISCR